MKAIILGLAVAMAALSGAADAAPNCKKGKPCGGSCIAFDKVFPEVALGRQISARNDGGSWPASTPAWQICVLPLVGT